MLFFCALIIFSMIYSRFLISVGMFGLIALSLFDIENGRMKWNWRFRKIELSSPVLAMLAITLFFWIIFISGLWSGNAENYWERVRIKLPFLFLPFAFIFLPRISKKAVVGLFYVLIVSGFISALGVIFYYSQDPEMYNEMIERGKSMPTPVNHIRYSLLLALASLAALIIGYRKHHLKYRWESRVIFVMGILLFFFLHFLAVRSGLAVAYSALVVISIFVIFKQRKWWLSVLIIISLCLLPLISYLVFPSFFQKFNYMRTDMEKIMEGEGDAYSDATRLRSYEIGWQIYLDHPFIGIGAGDLRDEMEKRFKEKYPTSTKYILPHNQFITTLAATGLLGFILFLTAFIQPLSDGRWKESLLFLSFQLTAFLSFMVENTLDNSVGVAFYCVFTLIFLSYFDFEEKEE